jgi:hypothetical protein
MLEKTHKFGIIELDKSHLLLTGDPEALKMIQIKIEELQDMNTYVKEAEDAEKAAKGTPKSSNKRKRNSNV